MIHLLWLNLEIKVSYSMDENLYMFVTEATTSENTLYIYISKIWETKIQNLQHGFLKYIFFNYTKMNPMKVLSCSTIFKNKVWMRNTLVSSMLIFVIHCTTTWIIFPLYINRFSKETYFTKLLQNICHFCKIKN
jgi:hypothetical protein